MAFFENRQTFLGAAAERFGVTVFSCITREVQRTQKVPLESPCVFMCPFYVSFGFVMTTAQGVDSWQLESQWCSKELEGHGLRMSFSSTDERD